MKYNQDYSPKFWVAHFEDHYDIISETMGKSLQETQIKYQDLPISKLNRKVTFSLIEVKIIPGHCVSEDLEDPELTTTKQALRDAQEKLEELQTEIKDLKQNKHKVTPLNMVRVHKTGTIIHKVNIDSTEYHTIRLVMQDGELYQHIMRDGDIINVEKVPLDVVSK